MKQYESTQPNLRYTAVLVPIFRSAVCIMPNSKPAHSGVPDENITSFWALTTKHNPHRNNHGITATSSQRFNNNNKSKTGWFQYNTVWTLNCVDVHTQTRTNIFHTRRTNFLFIQMTLEPSEIPPPPPPPQLFLCS